MFDAPAPYGRILKNNPTHPALRAAILSISMVKPLSPAGAGLSTINTIKTHDIRMIFSGSEMNQCDFFSFILTT
jgi:hypothetical protein